LRRLESASYDLPPLWSLVAALPLAWAVLAGSSARLARLDRFVTAALVVGGATLLCLGARQWAYSLVWDSVRPSVPILAAHTCWRVAFAPGTNGRQRQWTFAAVAVAFFVSLVQYPMSRGIYFCFAAPLILVGLAFSVRLPGTRLVTSQAVLLVFY